MLKLHVSQSDWSLAKKYWHDLGKHLNRPDDTKKVDFLNRTIFESAGLNGLHSQSSTTGSADEKDRTLTNIPSIGTMSEIMNEIDNELETTEKKINESQTVKIKMDEKMKAFIRRPV